MCCEGGGLVGGACAIPGKKVQRGKIRVEAFAWFRKFFIAQKQQLQRFLNLVSFCGEKTAVKFNCKSFAASEKSFDSDKKLSQKSDKKNQLDK